MPAGTFAAREHKQWLLSHSLYRCKHLLLGHVAPPERRAVLRNLLLAWAPFDQAEYRVAWRGDTAFAIGWDREVVARLLAAAGTSKTATLWPETFMREPMVADGTRLLRCLEGFESQVWRSRELLASRWWPAHPDAGEAAIWLRSLCLDDTAASSMRTVVAVPWHRKPTTELLGLDGLLSTSSRLERIAVGAALVGLTALTAAQARQAWAAYEELQSAQRDRERLLLEAAPVIAARDRAEALARDVGGLASQMTGVLPLELLEHLADVLPARGAILKELELSGKKLRLGIDLSPEVSRSAVVKELQAGGWLTEVNEVRDSAVSRNWLVFDAILADLRAPAMPARPPRPAAAPASPGAVLPSATPAATPAPPVAEPDSSQAAEPRVRRSGRVQPQVAQP